MRVKILKIETGTLVDARIKDGKKMRLPSIHEGWRFNFPQNAKAKGAHVYVLVTDESPAVIEGCLIYEMKNSVEPYMAYIEIAPHNKGKSKRYDRVAGCLIAFACRLSFTLGQEYYKGWLAFDVLEPTKKDQAVLMALYSKKYKAQRFMKTTTMLISPQDGEALIEEYLET